MIMISRDMTRAEALAVWNENMDDLVDAFIAADVDPDQPGTPTAAIIEVIIAWIHEGDECAAA